MSGIACMVRDGLSASVGLALLFDSLFRQAGEVQIEEKYVLWCLENGLGEVFSRFSSFHFFNLLRMIFFFQPNDFLFS